MMNAWGRAAWGLLDEIQRSLGLFWATGSDLAAVAVVVSKSHLVKHFDRPDKTYLAEHSNGTLVFLQLAGPERAVDYGELAVGSESDFPGERRNCDAAAAAVTQPVG